MVPMRTVELDITRMTMPEWILLYKMCLFTVSPTMYAFG